MIRVIIFVLFLVLLPLPSAIMRKMRDKRRARWEPHGNLKKAKADYICDLPFGGNLCATYSRMREVGSGGEGNIIGSLLLVWYCMNQIDILEEKYGGAVIYLRPANPNMPKGEASLYSMLMMAADLDGILRKGNLHKLARKRHSSISSWIVKYRLDGSRQLDDMGAYEVALVKSNVSFGLHTRTGKRRQLSRKGQELTIRLLGFKRYLEDFTVINDREVREADMWKWYLVFAQLFGFADRLAKQFKRMDPAFFLRPDAKTTDILAVTSICNSFGDSMYNGYLYGVNVGDRSYLYRRRGRYSSAYRAR